MPWTVLEFQVEKRSLKSHDEEKTIVEDPSEIGVHRLRKDSKGTQRAFRNCGGFGHGRHQRRKAAQPPPEDCKHCRHVEKNTEANVKTVTGLVENDTGQLMNWKQSRLKPV